MPKMFLDIETIPADESQLKVLEEIYSGEKNRGKKVGTFEEFIESTGLDGTFGRIFCISYALDDEPVQCLCEREKEMLKKFWEIAEGVELFVGFNLFDFDLRFIYQRSIINGVEPTKDLPFRRYCNFPIYDIMHEWVKWNFYGKISLDKLAKALGIPSSKKGIDGSMVAEYVRKGKHKEVCEYCDRDVEVTRKIYKKMIFEE